MANSTQMPAKKQAVVSEYARHSRHYYELRKTIPPSLYLRLSDWPVLSHYRRGSIVTTKAFYSAKSLL